MSMTIRISIKADIITLNVFLLISKPVAEKRVKYFCAQ